MRDLTYTRPMCDERDHYNNGSCETCQPSSEEIEALYGVDPGPDVPEFLSTKEA